MEKDFTDTIDYVRGNDIDLEGIVTATYRMEDAPAAFKDFDRNAGDMLKVILEF